MNKDLLKQRIEDLKHRIEVGAAELNKLIGRLQEAELQYQYILDKEKHQDTDLPAEPLT